MNEEQRADVPDPSMLDAALERAVRDDAVFVYGSLPGLFECALWITPELREEIQAAFEERGPMLEGKPYSVAFVRIDDVPDGTWCVRFPDEKVPGYFLIVASDQERYDGALMMQKLSLQKRFSRN